VWLERGQRAQRASVSGVLGDERGFPTEAVHPLAGRVVDAAGEGLPDTWVVIHDGGRWTKTGEDGRFFFYGIAAGEHELEARAGDGTSVAVTVTVPLPGPAPDLRLARAA
jgi:glutamate synthase domain-containing protein 3